MKSKKKIITNIGILLIATGKYVSFLDQFIDSAEKYFMRGPNYKITYFVFTDAKYDRPNVLRIYQRHRKFPYPTLMRYHIFLNSRKILSKMDYLFYCDVDTRFVGPVGKEILGKLVATRHGLFYDIERKNFTYENREESRAYISSSEGKYYFCGGFNGGLAKFYLEMAQHIANSIDLDIKNKITAVWHDESHLNRYFVDYPPDKILHPGYCYPEGGNIPFAPFLIALDKDHASMRYSGFERLVKYIWYYFLDLIGPVYRRVKKILFRIV